MRLWQERDKAPPPSDVFQLTMEKRGVAAGRERLYQFVEGLKIAHIN